MTESVRILSHNIFLDSNTTTMALPLKLVTDIKHVCKNVYESKTFQLSDDLSIKMPKCDTTNIPPKVLLLFSQQTCAGPLTALPSAELRGGT